MRMNMRNNSGFSLLEMLIVAGIFMFVLIPVLTVFTTSYESYLVQDDVSSTQQNIRTALMYLRKDIRMAGAGLGDGFFMIDLMDEDGDGDLAEAVTVYGISAGNGIGPNDSDELIVRYIDFDANPCDDGSGAAANFCSDLPALNLPGGRNESSSESDVSQDLSQPPFDAWDEDCECGGEVYDHQGGFDLPVLITSPDGRMSDMLVVTGIQPNAGQVGGRLNNHKVQKFVFQDKSFTVENKIANTYPPGSTISYFNIETFQRVRYFLGGDDDTTLMRQLNDEPARPLAEGIEDLQFDFLGDFDNDGSAVEGGAPEWYNLNYLFANDGNFVDEDDQQDVRMVRLRMLARTSKEWQELGATGRPDLDEEDGTDTTAGTDHFRRRVIEQDVQVRNLGLE